MGSGASKKSTAEETKKQKEAKRRNHDEDDDDDEVDLPSFTKRPESQRLEQAGLLPSLPINTSAGNQSQVRRKIVGLIETDDEDDEEEDDGKSRGFFGGTKKKAKEKQTKKKVEDKKLIKDLSDLDRTFESLEVEANSHSSSTWQNRPHRGRPGLTRSETFDNDRGYSTSSQMSQPPVGYDSLRGRSFKGRGGAFSSQQPKPLKFSWEGQTPSTTHLPDKDSEEWTYRQTVIDGFDPDKFRKVNNRATKAGSGISTDSGIQIERQVDSASSGITTRAMHMQFQEMPGVPSYDRGERQLLASLEQELGVL